MKILGITGMTGAGKSTLLREAEKFGCKAFDCDQIYHRLLSSCEPMQKELQAQFPEAFENGQFDRKALGRIAFADPEKLTKLNKITHKYVISEIKKELFKAHEEGASFAAVDAIALIESGLGQYCDLTVCVVAPEETRVKRLMERDGISREYAISRIRAQKSEADFRKMCDLCLENNGTREEFEQKCHEFLKKLTTERKVTL